MDDMFLQVNLGSVGATFGELMFSFKIHNNGNAHLLIYGHERDDDDHPGLLVTLDGQEYEKLKEIIRKADEVIEKCRSTGQKTEMLVSY